MAIEITPATTVCPFCTQPMPDETTAYVDYKFTDHTIRLRKRAEGAVEVIADGVSLVGLSSVEEARAWAADYALTNHWVRRVS